MTINYTITTLKRDLIRSFAVFDSWFDKEDDFLDFRPPDGKSVREIFTRALDTSEALMKLIDTGSDRVRATSIDGATNYELNFDLEESNAANVLATFFGGGDGLNTYKSLPEIRSELRDQLDRCLCHLELLSNGEGVLFNTNSEANDSIDFYQCLQLLSIALKKYADLLTNAEGQFADVRS